MYTGIQILDAIENIYREKRISISKIEDNKIYYLNNFDRYYVKDNLIYLTNDSGTIQEWRDIDTYICKYQTI